MVGLLLAARRVLASCATLLLSATLASCSGRDEASSHPDGQPDAQPDAQLDARPDAQVDGQDDARATGPDAAPPGSDASPRRTVVRVHYPSGIGPAGTRKVTLRGSTAPWSWTTGVELRAEADDTWVLETEALTVEAEWKPLLDDATWSRGPNYRVRPGATVDVWPHFVRTQGRYERYLSAFTSAALGNTRGVWVYWPPTALENPKARFPVVYMHDGQNLFDAKTAFGGNEWKVDETMDAAAEDGSIREAIVVGPENTANRLAEYTPTADPAYAPSGAGDAYLKMLVEELKPRIDAELPTMPGRQDTAIVGSSLGGLISVYAGCKQATTWGLVGALSPSTWWDSKAILSTVLGTKGAAARPLRVYVDSGDAGASSDGVADTARLADAYRALGYAEGVDLRYVVQKGATHSEVYWAQRLPGALAFLLGPR